MDPLSVCYSSSRVTRPLNYVHAQYTIVEVKDVILEKDRATFWSWAKCATIAPRIPNQYVTLVYKWAGVRRATIALRIPNQNVTLVYKN